jgi:hypothetical protein
MMRTPEAADLLAGINRWTAIESKSDDPEGIAAMMAEAERDFPSSAPARHGAATGRGCWFCAIWIRCTRLEP